MPFPKQTKAFSLVEVVVAVGIFAIAIVSIIGLLGPINQSVADTRDFDDASRVVSIIREALTNNYNFNDISNVLPTDGKPSDLFYADRNGARIGNSQDSKIDWEKDSEGNSLPPDISPDSQKFFEIYFRRNTELSSNDGNNPDSSAGFLAFNMELRWPAYLPNGKKVEASQQSTLIVPMAITR